MADIEIPKGYIMDAHERLVPIKNVKQIDLDRDKLVREIAREAQELHHKLAAFRASANERIDAFIDRSAKEYEVSMAGEKGHATLSAYDGSLRIQVGVAERMEFDERLQVARKIINQCIRRWARNADSKVKTLVQDAFKVDKKGRLDTRRILDLRKLDIEDPEWKKAMEAISDSIHTARSKRYLRFQRRGGDGRYQLITLNIAGV